MIEVPAVPSALSRLEELQVKHRREAKHHFAPECRCGSRRTVRIGKSALQRQCQDCGRTFRWRFTNGILQPFSLDVAMEIDMERAS